MFHDQCVDFDGFSGTVIRRNKPDTDLCTIMVEVANPFYGSTMSKSLKIHGTVLDFNVSGFPYEIVLCSSLGLLALYT